MEEKKKKRKRRIPHFSSHDLGSKYEAHPVIKVFHIYGFL